MDTLAKRHGVPDRSGRAPFELKSGDAIMHTAGGQAFQGDDLDDEIFYGVPEQIEHDVLGVVSCDLVSFRLPTV